MSKRRITGLFIVAAMLPLAVANADETQQREDTLVAKKSLSELRSDYFEKEEAFYKLFNQLNEDRDYDVRCYYERRTGTRIKNHVCRAKFVSDAFSSHAARSGGNRMNNAATQDSDPEFVRKSEIFENKLTTAVSSSPELQLALVSLNEAREQFVARQDAENRH